jgi:hypothetical protein
MQGPTENALMLVAAGNAYQQGRDISGFWPDAPTFKFLNLCEFRLPPPSGKDADEYPLLASDPMEFFRLQKPNCRGYRLHHGIRKRGPNQQIDAPDRMLTAFVGGGAQWLIEVVGNLSSDLWEGFHRIEDRSSERPWACTHIKVGLIPANEPEPVGLAEALSDLRVTLPDIEAYAHQEKLDNFADCFARAHEALEGKSEKAPWAADIVRYTGFSDRQLDVLEAINHAWVFGGIGSWNDIGGSGDKRYEDVSERLYNALNDCIAGLANSTFRL